MSRNAAGTPNPKCRGGGREGFLEKQSQHEAQGRWEVARQRVSGHLGTEIRPEAGGGGGGGLELPWETLKALCALRRPL